jgi:hypothetical protein
MRHVLHDEVSVRAAASWNIDRMMPRAKAVNFRRRDAPADRSSSATDTVGGSQHSIVAQLVNKANDTALGAHARQELGVHVTAPIRIITA